MGRRLTEAAHDAVAAVLGPGDWAVDATAGNGHDTLFLASTVGPAGHVLAFDIQDEALAACRRRLANAGVAERVTLVRAGHETLAEHLACAPRARPAAVMFNLGYLPGGDHDITTRPETSTQAIREAVAHLRPGGIVTVMAYRGHPAGRAEAEAVARACATIAEVYKFEVSSEAAPNDGPVLWVLRAPAA